MPKTSIKKKLERVASKIPNLDPLIGGGFEKGTINVVIGGPGSGKSIFATQFLIGGMQANEKCLYVTFEEKKEQFYLNMLETNMDLEDFEKKKVLYFLEYTPLKVKTMLEEGGGAIESIIFENKISRVVIDSITAFALLFEGELAQREAALDLFNMIRKWKCTALLTLEEDPLTRSNSTKALEFETDSTIVLYLIKEKNQRQRFIEVRKMRGTQHSKNIFKYNIDPKIGIVLDKKPCSIIPEEIH